MSNTTCIITDPLSWTGWWTNYMKFGNKKVTRYHLCGCYEFLISKNDFAAVSGELILPLLILFKDLITEQ